MSAEPDALEIVPLGKPPAATVRVPGSKSITNRALVLAALTSRGTARTLTGALRSEDTEVMIEALRALGFRVLTDWPEATVGVGSEADAPLIPARRADLFVANSGTTMRFLTAVVSLGHGRYRLDGVPRMRERPIEDLLSALRHLGVNAYSEHEGCPPVVIEAEGLRGGTVRVKGDVSSQFLSGLLLAAPFAQSALRIKVDGLMVSWPYVCMTVQMLRQWGLSGGYHLDGDCADYEGLEAVLEAARFGHQARRACFHIPADGPISPPPQTYAVEPDASAASYFFGAAAISQGEVTVPGLTRKSLQGDVYFVDLLGQMGCRVMHSRERLTVRGGPLRGIDADMNDISDTVMTLAAVACFAEGPTTIRNVAHIRHKETDRLAALATELRRLGAGVEEFADGLTITPGPLHGAAVETYNDHRMAMSLALIGLKVPGVVIKNPGCVAKTYPGFFADLEKLR
jgi:3-phosphoshikimate 1-carboxyvinyltransferase